jgi:polysaccharide export outer membrane protein
MRMNAGRRVRVTALWLGPILTVLVLAAGVAQSGEQNYHIGVDDVLTVSVWDNKDLDQMVFVRPDGKISLPLLGEVQAGGLTVAELISRLAEMYGRTIKGAQVTVGVREIRSRPIFFVGGVAKAGPMQLTQELTLFQAISMAGGVVAGADLEKAFVLRGDKLIAIDFVKLIQKGDVSQNIKLIPGDTIVVPVAEVVYVQGEVKAPSSIKFTNDLTILKALAQAGGFTPLAAGSRVNLIRGEGTKRRTIRVNVDNIMRESGSAPDTLLQPNDIIIVPQRLF